MKRKILGIFPDRLANSLPSKLDELGWDLLRAEETEAAFSLLGKAPDCYVGLYLIEDCDQKTLAQCEEILLQTSHMEWIALVSSACLSKDVFCEFIVANFYDYHTTPMDIPRLLVTLGRAFGKASMKKKLSNRQPYMGEFGMIGKSTVMQELYASLKKICKTDSTVLIYGESGTGKELAARSIHQHSARRSAPFVAVNCSAFPSHLIQSELFGYEKGAFTGAVQRKVGRIEVAAGGTIFLDEIGDLPLSQQVNLLRFLQEKTIERLGSNMTITVDVRVIAATHVDLEKAVEEGQFREDLFYRLNVLNITVPPLRDRNGDIDLLARAFFEDHEVETNRVVKGFSRQAISAMCIYDWPGNVRELMNRVRSAKVMCEQRLITPADLGLEIQLLSRSMASLEDAREKAENDIIQRSLKINNNNISKTARDLGVSRVTLYRLINKLEILL